MPYKALKPCRYRNGCSKLTGDKSGFCEAHKKQKNREYNFKRDINTQKLYKTETWKKLRLNHLRSNPYCIECNITYNLEIHHIIPHYGNPELFFDESNLQTLCKSCHSRKTIKEINMKRKER